MLRWKFRLISLLVLATTVAAHGGGYRWSVGLL